MLTTDDLRRIFREPNVAAFARVVRESESTQDERAYCLRWAGPDRPPAWIDDLSRHPKVYAPTGGGRVSSAAGAYQFTWTTWYDEILAHWPELTFAPADQDAAFVGLLSRTGRALDYVLAGMVNQAINSCRGRWTSLPGATENHARYTWDAARAVFAQYGGRAATSTSVAAMNLAKGAA